MVQEGASVLMADNNASALGTALEAVKAACIDQAGHVEIRVVNVASEKEIQAAVDALDSWGGLDVIFNNAGIMHPHDGYADEVTEEVWDLTNSINVKGVWYGCKHAVRSLRKHGKKRGSIINTASVVAIVGSAAPQLAYTASKGAILALTRELATVHAREGYRFNTICPAPLK